ncbi:MAG: hypothetical protein Q4E11_07345 [Corynebacterium sp.]|uniref:DUF6542 domain-containing protein n=1 Tax=Corynebacterium sp. TaxID=1720 RepID=UPI0026DDBF9C|nr:DUF6542 domain-containing protein [Corynebacterium sp.]MDO5030381.1 hypothetical protein [Corynebacterium sp.]
MSNRSAVTRTSGGSKPLLPRVPMWVPPLLMLLAGIIGLIFSVPNGAIGKPYFIAFTIAALAGTLLVVPRGLVVTVAQIPILFAIVTFLTAWFTGSLADPENGGATSSTSRKARLVTSAYPIVQQFPWLLILLIVCIIIAVWRYLEITRKQQKSHNIQLKEAKRRQVRDDAAVESSSQVRRRLAESDRRTASRANDRSAARRPAADIIRDAEARRQARQQAAQKSTQSGAAASTGTRAGAGAGNRAAARPTPRPATAESRPQPQGAERLQQPSPNRGDRTANQPRRAAAQARRPIERPNRPMRSTPEFPRRQAEGGARMWGEPSAASAPRANRQARPEYPERPGTGTHRRTEEWPPRQQRPRQERMTGRDNANRRYRK